MSIGWIVYERVYAPEFPNEPDNRARILKSFELGRLTAPDQATAIRMAHKRWNRRDLHVQSEVSAAVEADENVDGVLLRKRKVQPQVQPDAVEG